MSTTTNWQTLLSQRYLVSTSVQLLKLQELSQKNNARLKIKLNASVTKPCQEIETEVIEAANPRQEEDILAKHGQAKNLTLTLEK